ncbi:hypothetical protein TNCV_3630231 [Trichonephila clavipes]|nr:hypothetical protein TNCV_3630231 [Trichonephila clavipes]
MYVSDVTDNKFPPRTANIIITQVLLSNCDAHDTIAKQNKRHILSNVWQTAETDPPEQQETDLPEYILDKEFSSEV